MIDENTEQKVLVTQASDFSLSMVAAMVENGAIDPDPEYQRRKRWSARQQSSLIESFLLSLPVPPVYLAEERTGVYSVIDGKQRITAIYDFMQGRLRLTSLSRLQGLNGLHVNQLPPDMVANLNMRPHLRAVTLLRQSDPDLKYEVFIRLNRGGETLNDQEVRNVAGRGPLNDRLISLAENQFLWSQFNIDRSSQRYRQMADVEWVLRYLTLDRLYPNFSGNMSAEMDKFLIAHRNSEDAAREASERFTAAIERCRSIFGAYAFKRPESGSFRGRGLLGMYDAEMLAVSRLTEAEVGSLIRDSQSALARVLELGEDAEFSKSVTQGTNTPARLAYRVDAMLGALRGGQ